MNKNEHINQAVGFLETIGLTPAMVALDAMEKAAEVRIFQAELNDFYGVCMKVQGDVAAVKTAIDSGYTAAAKMGGNPVFDIIPNVVVSAWNAIESHNEFNPLIQQDVVFSPSFELTSPSENREETRGMDEPIFALGFIETQGFTAVFEAIDSACKAAKVEVVGKEKLGGGYITVVIKGEVAAVKEAVEVGKAKVEGLGKLIAAHVIPRPSSGVLGLLPKI